MPVTEHKKLFRILLLPVFVCGLFSQEAVDPVHHAAVALGNGDSAGFDSAFDPSTPGIARIRGDAAELVRQADAQSTIRTISESGSGQLRTLQLDWDLRIRDNDTSGGLTHRQATVTCGIALRGGEWKIVRFEPRDFFRPARAAGAWKVLDSAASALNSGNAPEFLSFFDKSMPGYDRLKAGAVELVSEGEVQSSIELASNEGTDSVRTVEVDWSLQIVSEDTRIQRAARRQRVKCRVELRGNHWLITGADPVDFFRAISLGLNVPHQGVFRAVLLDGQLERGSGVRRDPADRSAHGAEA